METHELIGLVEEQQALLIAVGVREKTIDDVQAEYKQRRKAIAAELRRLELDDPNPFVDLWEWYHYWKENGLSTYVSRRTHAGGMYRPLLEALENVELRALESGLDGEETGWAKVDGQLGQLRERFAGAETVEDFQAIGLLCRDILLSLGFACYDHERHGGGAEKAPASAAARLDLVVAVEAGGGPNKQLRALLKAMMEFANHVQHDRAGTIGEAAIAAESAVFSVAVMRVLMRAADAKAAAAKQAEMDALVREIFGDDRAPDAAADDDSIPF